MERIERDKKILRRKIMHVCKVYTVYLRYYQQHIKIKYTIDLKHHLIDRTTVFILSATQQPKNKTDL